MSRIEAKGEPVESEETGWPLEKVLGSVAVVLAVTVVIRAIGGLLSGLGVSTFHFNAGATSGSGLVLNQNDIFFPTYLRLQYGTAWADWTSGLALLAALGLVTLPRMVWDLPGSGRWTRLPAGFAMGIGGVAVLTTAGALIGTVNWIWHANRIAGPAEPINVAAGVAAVALAVLCTVLCWYSLPYLRAGEDDTEESSNLA